MQVDIAVLTAKVEEYKAFQRLLTAPALWNATDGTTNQYAWTVGTLPTADPNRTFSVILGLTHEQTNVPASLAAVATFDTFSPRYVVFMGIAGSLDPSVKKGDVLIAEYVKAYDYGSLSEQGVFEPRQQFQEATDLPLRTSADVFASINEWWAGAGEKPDGGKPVLHFGGLASGNMVIEGTRNNYFEPIVRSDNWLRAVDMESAGVALAVRSLRERGQAVGLMIVRGISDVPASVSGDAPNRNTRWQWTDYASKAAAVFLQQFITRAFPTAPRGQPTVAAGRVRRQLDPFVFAAYRSRFARANDLPAVHTMNNNLFDPEDLVPATTLEAWWRRNPLTIRIVSSPKGDAVGYWHILPFTEEAFRKMSEGRQKERDIGDGEIAAYSDLRPGSVYLYITAVAALDQASSSPVVLDMIAFITLVEELIGVDGIAAMSVSDDPLNLIASFVMARVESTDPQVWLLNSRGEVKRALATGRAHLDELKGLVPETPRSEDQTLRQLLAART